jgi:hypothetical protein
MVEGTLRLTLWNAPGYLSIRLFLLLHRNSLHLRLPRRIRFDLSNISSTISLGSRTGTKEALPHRQLDLRMDHVLGVAAHDGISSIPWSHYNTVFGRVQLSWLS